MVHALQEIRRVLAPEGILIDLRPLAASWPVEVASGTESRVAGHIHDLQAGLAEDEAANAALQNAAENGWWILERQEHFPFFYYWDSPNEMQEYIEEEWEDFGVLDPADWKRLRSQWATANAEARVRIRLDMLISRWRKSDRTLV